MSYTVNVFTDIESIDLNDRSDLSGLCVYFFCVWVRLSWRMLPTEFGLRQYTTACYYGPCDWQHVGEKVIAEVCLWWWGPSGDRMFSRLREAHRDTQITQNWWLISHTPFTPVCILFSSTAWARAVADSELSPSRCTVLKDSTCLDFRTSGLVRSKSTSHVNSLQSWQTLSICLVDWGESDIGLNVLSALPVMEVLQWLGLDYVFIY